MAHPYKRRKVIQKRRSLNIFKGRYYNAQTLRLQTTRQPSRLDFHVYNCGIYHAKARLYLGGDARVTSERPIIFALIEWRERGGTMIQMFATYLISRFSEAL